MHACVCGCWGGGDGQANVSVSQTKSKSNTYSLTPAGLSMLTWRMTSKQCTYLSAGNNNECVTLSAQKLILCPQLIYRRSYIDRLKKVYTFFQFEIFSTQSLCSLLSLDSILFGFTLELLNFPKLRLQTTSFQV